MVPGSRFDTRSKSQARVIFEKRKFPLQIFLRPAAAGEALEGSGDAGAAGEHGADSDVAAAVVGGGEVAFAAGAVVPRYLGDARFDAVKAQLMVKAVGPAVAEGTVMGAF